MSSQMEIESDLVGEEEILSLLSGGKYSQYILITFDVVKLISWRRNKLQTRWSQKAHGRHMAQNWVKMQDIQWKTEQARSFFSHKHKLIVLGKSWPKRNPPGKKV
jgi:hypothetical protein